MEGVDHVDVVQVSRGCLVGEVDRMLQREVPDREGLKFGIACHNAALMLVIQLAEAGGHLAAPGAGCGHDHQTAGGLNIVIAAEAIV